MIRNVLKKGRVLLASAVFLLATAATAVAGTVSQPATVSAATSCDKVNIVYCGINGGSVSGDINNFKSRYNSNKSGHASSPTVKKDYTDIQAVYNWAGASKSIVAGMNTSNTKLGTLYKDGHITVNGATVGTDASVTARFNNGAGFTKVEGNVYARKTTTSFAESSAPVIVYFNSNGQMTFAVMVECGNAVKATPKTTPKPPAASLVCDQLAFSQSKSDENTFTFTAKATAKNTTITNYVFNFGDNSTKTVTTSGNSVTTTHAYAKYGTYTATVAVNSKDKTNVTSSACAVKITIAQPADLVCDSLTATQVGTTNEYNFAAKATPTNTTITSYVFDYGDKTNKTVTTAATSANGNHTYTTPGTYTAVVTVNSKDKQNVTSAKCAVKITIAPPAECKPGVPEGSPECNETPVMTCDELLITPSSTNKSEYNFVVKASAQHATIVSYAVDFGDKTTPYSGTEAGVTHTYASAGTYTVVATVTFSANGQTYTKTSEACAGKVTITQPMCTVPGKETLPANSPECVTSTCTAPNGQTYPEGSSECTPPTTTTTTTPPTELPNTGAGSVVGLFAGVSIVGAAAHRIFASRRFGLSR